jgi:N6-adenosine-specific RNA methylase IME4
MITEQAKNLQSKSEGAHLIIDPEIETLMPTLTKQECEGLEKSLLEEGCRDSVVVDKRTRIVVEGQNRVRICRAHNIPFKIVEKDFANRNEMKLYAIKNQLGRRNLTKFARGLLGLELESLRASEAKQRQREHGGTAPGKPKTLSSNLTEVSSHLDARKEAAKTVGLSEGTLHMVKVINEKATEQEKAQLRNPDSWVTVHNVFRRIRRDQLKTETPPFPAGKFALIYADPPWTFESVESENRTVQNHYATMSLEELMLLPVPTIAQNDCILMMWAPACKVDEAMRLMKAWGFTYRTCAVWVKDKVGMGHWFRTQHEMLLLAIKGNPPTPPPEKRFSSVINAPRPQQHSEKPDKVYRLIEQMYPRFEKIELFARQARKGWTAWGNEIASPPTLH